MASEALKEIRRRSKYRERKEKQRDCPKCGEPAELLQSRVENHLCRNKFCTIIVFS